MNTLQALHSKHFLDIRDESRSRQTLTRRYSFAIPTNKAIQTLVSLSPVVELGAGTGYWASLVAKTGGQITALDDMSWTEKYRGRFGYWYPVSQGQPSDLVNYSDHALFLCWPPYDVPVAIDALRHWKGKDLVYIGEGWGGCTGDDVFHDTLEKDFILLNTIKLPQFAGIHDNMYVYRRR